MINLVDLYYQINKDIFFTDKISNEAFSIYYNKHLQEVMWNYAAISNLSTLQKNFEEICRIFTGLEKKIGFYLREDQKNDICKLIEHQIMIKYPESWLRFEAKGTDILTQAQKISTKQEQQGFVKLFSILNKKYYHNMSAFLPIFEKTFSAQNFQHFLIYHEHRAVGLAILSMYKDYALISHLQTLPEFSSGEYYKNLFYACLKSFHEQKGKELYLQIIDNPTLEKWALKQGFNKMFNSYLLSR